MDSLVGYGSDDDNDTERYGARSSAGGAARRKEDDTNYDDVNMDMSEGTRTLSQESQAESEPELPPAEPAHPRSSSRDDQRSSDDSRDRDRDRERDRKDKRQSPTRSRSDRDRRDKEDRHRSDRNGSRRGLLGDRPHDKYSENKVPALMDLKPFGGEPPPGVSRRATDTRDAVSPRFVDRDRRDREKDRERDRDRHSRRSQEKRSYSDRHERGERSRSRGAAYPPPSTSSSDRRGSPSGGDYRPSSYKVNRKLEVMEKMGLQIKTPDGSMATAQQLRAAAGDPPAAHSAPAARALQQVQKRKLLWANKNKSEAEEAAKWTGAKFSQDNDGRQASKFMRLMGIKEPAAISSPAEDPIKKQEEMFQAMQAQYDVARATTHTMRGHGLGFQRGNY